MRTLKLIFEKQSLHIMFLAVLVFVFGTLSDSPRVQAGSLGGIGSVVWLWIAMGLAVLHQVLVWFCWRTELHASLLSRTMGSAGFTLYAVLFSVIGIARTAAVFVVSIANEGTLGGSPIVMKVIAVILLIPAGYLFYSVRRYFGFERAFGIDHFDASYRTAPMIKEGIFRYTSNGMYVFGFLLLWVPALWYASAAGICAALFNHLYIWVHYYTTEKPDMRRSYGSHADG